MLIFGTLPSFADLVDSYDSRSEGKTKEKVKPLNHSKENKFLETKDKDQNASKNQKEKNKKKKDKNTKDRAPVHFAGLGLTGLKSEGLVELHKNVVVTQEDFRLESEEAKIYLDDSSNEVKKVLAEGKVKITKKDETTGKIVRADSQEAEFDNLTQIITLKGNARIVKGEDILAGNLIFYNLKTGWIKVEKVKGVVNP